MELTREVIDTETAKRISRLRLIALMKKHPEFSGSIGLEIVPKAVSEGISKTPSFTYTSTAVAVGKNKGHD